MHQQTPKVRRPCGIVIMQLKSNTGSGIIKGKGTEIGLIETDGFGLWDRLRRQMRHNGRGLAVAASGHSSLLISRYGCDRK